MMINTFDPTVKTTIAFLKLLKVKVNNITVDETLQSHPDWPNLLCISDSLNKWNIPNAAGRIDPEHIDSIPTPFIIYRNQMEIVTSVDEKEVSSFSNGKYRTESREDFLKRWNGIYLIAEKTEDSEEKQYLMVKRRSLINKIIPAGLALLLLTLSVLMLLRNTITSTSLLFAGTIIQYIILLTGIGVTSLLLWHEIDNDNPILKKVCTGIAKGNCDAILSSKQSKVFSWLSWSEVGFFYFAGGFLTLLFAEPSTQSIGFVAYLNILALPYTIFSIYYQGRVAKLWCILCLCVQALLLLGGVNVIANGMLFPLSSFTIATLLQYSLCYLLPVAIWYTLKPYLLRMQEAKNTKREYLRIKFNFEIFDTLLKKQRQITVPVDGLGINLGNPEATNTLVKVCNPFCGPCAKAHPKIEKLLSELSNLKVKIIFTTPNNPDDIGFRVVSHLLAIADKANKKELIQALDDWYLPQKKDYNMFIAKHPLDDNTRAQQMFKIADMFAWCSSMDIHYTPTIFLNGYELPMTYDIKDIAYFLEE